MPENMDLISELFIKNGGPQMENFFFIVIKIEHLNLNRINFLEYKSQ